MYEDQPVDIPIIMFKLDTNLKVKEKKRLVQSLSIRSTLARMTRFVEVRAETQSSQISSLSRHRIKGLTAQPLPLSPPKGRPAIVICEMWWSGYSSAVRAKSDSLLEWILLVLVMLFKLADFGTHLVQEIFCLITFLIARSMCCPTWFRILFKHFNSPQMAALR